MFGITNTYNLSLESMITLAFSSVLLPPFDKGPIRSFCPKFHYFLHHICLYSHSLYVPFTIYHLPNTKTLYYLKYYPIMCLISQIGSTCSSNSYRWLFIKYFIMGQKVSINDHFHFQTLIKKFDSDINKHPNTL